MKTLELKIEVRVGESCCGRGPRFKKYDEVDSTNRRECCGYADCIACQSKKGIIIGEKLSNWGLMMISMYTECHSDTICCFVLLSRVCF